jgi:hypothetical protein
MIWAALTVTANLTLTYTSRRPILTNGRPESAPPATATPGTASWHYHPNPAQIHNTHHATIPRSFKEQPTPVQTHVLKSIRYLPVTVLL